MCAVSTPERDGQMRFADTRRAKEEDVSALVQKATRGQFVDDAFVDGRLFGELEVAEVLLIRKIAELQVQLDRLLMAKTHLGIEQIAEEVGAGPACGSGLLRDLVELLLGKFSGGDAEVFFSESFHIASKCAGSATASPVSFAGTCSATMMSLARMTFLFS